MTYDAITANRKPIIKLKNLYKKVALKKKKQKQENSSQKAYKILDIEDTNGRPNSKSDPGYESTLYVVVCKIKRRRLTTYN